MYSPFIMNSCLQTYYPWARIIFSKCYIFGRLSSHFGGGNNKNINFAINKRAYAINQYKLLLSSVNPGLNSYVASSPAALQQGAA